VLLVRVIHHDTDDDVHAQRSPATLDGLTYLDTGHISYRAIYPSGTLLACAVVMTGP
jgi:hypothetical protein